MHAYKDSIEPSHSMYSYVCLCVCDRQGDFQVKSELFSCHVMLKLTWIVLYTHIRTFNAQLTGAEDRTRLCNCGLEIEDKVSILSPPGLEASMRDLSYYCGFWVHCQFRNPKTISVDQRDFSGKMRRRRAFI